MTHFEALIKIQELREEIEPLVKNAPGDTWDKENAREAVRLALNTIRRLYDRTP